MSTHHQHHWRFIKRPLFLYSASSDHGLRRPAGHEPALCRLSSQLQKDACSAAPWAPAGWDRPEPARSWAVGAPRMGAAPRTPHLTAPWSPILRNGLWPGWRNKPRQAIALRSRRSLVLLCTRRQTPAFGPDETSPGSATKVSHDANYPTRRWSAQRTTLGPTRPARVCLLSPAREAGPWLWNRSGENRHTWGGCARYCCQPEPLIARDGLITGDRGDWRDDRGFRAQRAVSGPDAAGRSVVAEKEFVSSNQLHRCIGP